MFLLDGHFFKMNTCCWSLLSGLLLFLSPLPPELPLLFIALSKGLFLTHVICLIAEAWWPRRGKLTTTMLPLWAQPLGMYLLAVFMLETLKLDAFNVWDVKAGVNLKAVSRPLKIGSMKIQISRSHFKQSKNSLPIPWIYVVGRFVDF